MRRSLTPALTVIAAVTLSLVPTTASAAATARTWFGSFTITPEQIDARDPAAQQTFSGVLMSSTGYVPGARVEIVELDGLLVAETTTDDSGRFQGVLPVRASLGLQALYRGDATHSGATSGRVYTSVDQVPTRVSIRLTPEPVREGQRVKATGLLERQNLDGSWAPMAGQDVTVWFEGLRSARQALVGYARTGLDGRYDMPVVVPGTGWWRVQYGYGDGYTGYDYTDGMTDILGADYAGRITGLKASGKKSGGKVDLLVQGRLSRRSATGDRPVVNQGISLHYSTDRKNWFGIATRYSEANGGFTLRGEVPAGSYWYVSALYHLQTRARRVPMEPTTYPDTGAGWAAPVPAPPGPVPQDEPPVVIRHRPAPTQATIDVAPAIGTIGGRATVSGVLQEMTASGGWQNLGGQQVKIYFRRDRDGSQSSGPEEFARTVRTDADGRYSTEVPVVARGGWFVSYLGQWPQYASVTWATDDLLYSTRNKTRFTGFNAAPEPVRRGDTLKLSGRLERFAGGTWKVAARRRVHIYFRPKGAKTWQLVAQASTDWHGRFGRSVKATRDGTWQIRYEATRNDHGASSDGDYVNVL